MIRSILLKKQDRGEADELVFFFGRDFGWARGIAKNSKKSRIRFGGSLEPLSLVELTLRPRRNDDLMWIDDSQVISGFLSLRESLRKLAFVSYMLEISSVFSLEGQPDNTLFDFLEALLQELDRHNPSDLMLIKHEINLLGILGYSPEFAICPVCGKQIDKDGDVVFDVSKGGVCHKICSSAPTTAIPISKGTLAIVRKALEAGPETLDRLKLSRSGSAELRVALSAFVRYTRGNEINSLLFLEKINEE